MVKKSDPLLPATTVLLTQLGDRLRLARLRRGLSAKQVAESAGMAPMTLRSLERGGAGVTMGAYLSIMQVLGIEKDLNLLAQADPVGRELQDAQLPARRKPVRRNEWAALSKRIDALPQLPPMHGLVAMPKAGQVASNTPPDGQEWAALSRRIDALPKLPQGWASQDGLSHPEELAKLIDSWTEVTKKRF